MAKPAKRRVQGGRTTPKGGHLPHQTRSSAPDPSARYTPPIPRDVKVSPVWVPVIMFMLLGIGTLVIIVNYTGALWETSNWYLLGGLVAILGGIITATQYH